MTDKSADDTLGFAGQSGEPTPHRLVRKLESLATHLLRGVFLAACRCPEYASHASLAGNKRKPDRRAGYGMRGGVACLVPGMLELRAAREG
jgi:hypothetical protein